MQNAFFTCIAILFLQACAFKPNAFSPTSVPSAPDYSKNSSWSALPTRTDPADSRPGQAPVGNDNDAPIDVFFIHPTTYTKKGNNWNASIADEKLNENTDTYAVKYQASIFNEAGNLYAPRYRQVHLKSFYNLDDPSISPAVELAYKDIEQAFEYYLAEYNKGKPVIIASHSQGTLHAKKLLQQYFNDKPLQNQLVAAYLIGWPVEKLEFSNIPPCSSPEQTGCICSWRTFKSGYEPPDYPKGEEIVVTNPLSWQTDQALVPKEENKGAVLTNFDKVLPQIADAQIHNGLLWAHKPKFPGSFLFSRKNYHVADFNFYYMNVKENARERGQAFLSK